MAILSIAMHWTPPCRVLAPIRPRIHIVMRIHLPYSWDMDAPFARSGTLCVDAMAAIIKSTLERHDIGLVRLVLFGSRSSGTARPDSDWDFLAVVDRPMEEMRRTLAPAQKAIPIIRGYLAGRNLPRGPEGAGSPT